MNNSEDMLFGKPIKEVLTPRITTHIDCHANNAFCGAAGPYELKHLNDLVSILNNDELASLINKVGISFGGPSNDLNRETLESVIDEADREVFYKEYQAILDSRE